MANIEKSDPVVTKAPERPKSKKLLLAVVGVLILIFVGGSGWYFMKGVQHADEPKATVVEQPTFLVLEPFTVNLQHEEEDQFLQIGITLKVANPEQADKLRQRLPEVRSHLLYLLSSKRASELMPIQGKKILAQEILVETNTMLGLHTQPQRTEDIESNATPNVETASGVEASHQEVSASAPVENQPVTNGGKNNNGVMEVLFTSFIIQ